ncbi:MAG TPA: anti-sigma factor [Propionibacteriaceae bacterium]|nr:anti-sigma factor [Propionibacteriaceae bacterium]
MTHLDSELLAGQALQTDQINANQLQHLATCPQCRAEVDELSRIAELGRDGSDLARPIVGEQALWRAISDELGLDTSAAASHTLSDTGRSPNSGPTEPSQSPVHDQVRRDEVPNNRPAPRRWMLLLAAAVGLIMGVGVTAAVNVARPAEVEVVSSTPLTALPGETGGGQADLVRDQGATALRISVEGSAPSSEYREVWLINNDGKRMYSLGVLPPTGSGTYPVPAMLGSSLDGFTIVDVSLEPYDGNAAHSLKSQVRGTLPL